MCLHEERVGEPGLLIGNDVGKWLVDLAPVAEHVAEVLRLHNLLAHAALPLGRRVLGQRVRADGDVVVALRHGDTDAHLERALRTLGAASIQRATRVSTTIGVGATLRFIPQGLDEG